MVSMHMIKVYNVQTLTHDMTHDMQMFLILKQLQQFLQNFGQIMIRSMYILMYGTSCSLHMHVYENCKPTLTA